MGGFKACVEKEELNPSSAKELHAQRIDIPMDPGYLGWRGRSALGNGHGRSSSLWSLEQNGVSASPGFSEQLQSPPATLIPAFPAAVSVHAEKLEQRNSAAFCSIL